ncbi:MULTISPECIES: EamA family transporter [Legionella]|uniref:Integral membrane protein n=1 Tax=Legionella drozanskii LLAP-1 TaxID=1212489 RepID=A0A0W0SQM9_9GAMM|nr:MULTISPECIES: EamA family transporter [Legionella]KTC85695.1 integral membrane protein [Legionella drozanskii LLAP-1]PJE15527.1 MAG: O-acetylserine/cysteine exporter [Legionella sp.]
MTIPHLFLVLLVVVVWGLNFLFVKLALEDISPIFLCCLRFILASIPAIFFVKRPAVPFRVIALYGLVMFALQFSFLFVGMSVGMTPGIGSIIMQTQVFFSMFFAVILLGERTSVWQILGAIISFSGIGLVATHFDKNVSLLGSLCILIAAATWGIGNLITKKIHHINMMALVVWGSFVAWFPLLLLSLIIEGPNAIIASLQHLTWKSTSSLFYIVYISTWVGYGVWNWLVSRYPVSLIVPFTLLIPVVGVLGSVLFLDEPFYLWKLEAGLLVISGLFINIFGARFFAPRLREEVNL